MLVIPAIDIRGGQCVRLRQGDYSQETIFGDPVEVAQTVARRRREYLHLVDLDGAKAGRPVNLDAISEIVSVATSFETPCQLGGGLRSEEDLKRVFDLGIARAIVGTRAIQDPDWLRTIVAQFPRTNRARTRRQGRQTGDAWLGNDRRNRCRRISGRALRNRNSRPSSTPTFRRTACSAGRTSTPPSEWPNAFGACPVVASGGISTAEDVFELDRRGVPACILGRSLYEGRIDLSALLQQLSDRG